MKSRPILDDTDAELLLVLVFVALWLPLWVAVQVWRYLRRSA